MPAPPSIADSATGLSRLQALARVADSVPAYMSYIDAGLRYTYVNPTYLRAFGRSAEEIEGCTVAEVLGPSFENVRPHLEACLEGHEQHFETLMGTVGDERTLAVTHLPDRDPSGRVIGIIVYGSDITEKRRTESALLQSEKLAAVGRLASSIAHEINNPLEAITNLIFLARNRAVHPDAKMYLESADRELRRVSMIANQTLRFHRQASSARAVSAAELFESVLGIYEGRLRNSGIRIELDFRCAQPITCFEGDVRQVLNNLIGNAIDAMPSGGLLHIRSHSAVDYASGRRGLALTVADSGSGIPAAALTHIFEPFFTTKGIGGTGLGLWVSAEVVRRHNGSLRVRSTQAESAHGTVFRLFLPDGC